MRRYRLLAAISLLLLPAAVRGLWFYHGLYRAPTVVQVPSFTEIQLPQPPPAEPTARPAAGDAGTAGKVVIIDRAHDNQFQLPDLDAITRMVLAQGASLEVVHAGDEFESSSFGSSDSLFAFSSRSLATRLKYASAYVVVAPQVDFSEAEIQHVARFVARGGRLLVILDPTRSGGGIDIFGFVLSGSAGDVSSANRLLEPHDLSFADDYLYNVLENEGNFRNVYLVPEERLAGSLNVSQVVFYAARSVDTRQGSDVLVADPTTYSSRTDRAGRMAAAALSPDGRALALGDLTFMTPPYDQVAGNTKFIAWLAGFLLGGERQQDLTDLPYLFTRPVEVLTSPAFSVQSETLQAVRSLQAALTSRGLAVTLTGQPSDGSDLLVMTLLEPSEETDPYLAEVDLTLPTDHPDGLLAVPGFGAFDPKGIGVLAAVQQEGRATLLILAEDKESLSQLAEQVGRGSLSDCVFQGQYALCRTGEGGGFESGSADGFDFNFDLDIAEPAIEIPATVPVPPTVPPQP